MSDHATPGLPLAEDAASALAAVLHPVARLMIGQGISLAAAVELLKQALVDEAQIALADEGSHSSDTRVSLLTGVHRKDVRRLRETPSTPTDAASKPPVSALVVARWISDPRFLMADRQPLPLPRTPGKATAAEPDFGDLVQAVSSDHSPRAVLDELLRLGVVVLDGDDRVRLHQAGFVPQPGRAEGLAILGQHLADHFSAAVHNNAPDRLDQTPMLEQSVFSEGLSADQAAALHALARKQWHELMVAFLQAATQAEARSEHSVGARHRIRFGTYFWQTQHSPAPRGDGPTGSVPDTHPGQP